MRIVFIHEVKSGNNENLIVNTDRKDFQYFRGTWLYSEAIYVKTTKDINKIIDKVRNDGYALKIGNI